MIVSGSSTGARDVLQRAPLLLLAVALSVVSALVAGLLPVSAPIGLILVIVAVLFFSHIRRAIRESPSRRKMLSNLRAPTPEPTSEVNLEDGFPDLRLARLFYYLGVLFIGELTFRPIFPITVSDWLFLLSFVAACSTLAFRRSVVMVYLPPALLIGILIFAIGALVSTFNADTPIQAAGVLARLLYLIVAWFWLATVVLQRIEHVRNAIVLWVFSAAMTGSGAIVQFVAGDVIPGAHVQWGRMTGFTENINDLGGVTSIAFVPALMLVLILAKTPWRVVVSGVLLILIAAGILLSGSVGGVVAALAATAVWFGCTRTRASRVLALGAIATAAFSLYSAQQSIEPPSAVQRIVRFGSNSPDDPSRTLDQRIAVYRDALKRIEENPVVGVGLGYGATNAGEQVHNFPLHIWFTTGIVGLIGMVFIFVTAARTAWLSMVASQTSIEVPLATALACSLIAFLVFIMSAPALFIRYGWLSVALVCALAAIQSRAADARFRVSETALVHALKQPV